MYQKFYGLQDTAFTIAPNPDYLFLGTPSRSAPLPDLWTHTGGFILLTGEVGTGKTTSRHYSITCQKRRILPLS